MPELNDQEKSAKWAYDLLQVGNFVILDTETTGLGNQAEIVQVALIDHEGNELVNSLIYPTVEIEPEAEAIHGISLESILSAPTFPGVFMDIWREVGKKDLVVYNAEFDLRLIRQSLRPYDLHVAFPTSDRRQCRIFLGGGSIHCAMLPYSAWCGEWNSYHGNYRWQKLPGGDHSALGDCRATLELIKRMAADWSEPTPEPIQEPSLDEMPF